MIGWTFILAVSLFFQYYTVYGFPLSDNTILVSKSDETEKKSWESANESCAINNKQLTSILTADILTEIKTDINEDFWVAKTPPDRRDNKCPKVYHKGDLLYLKYDSCDSKHRYVCMSKEPTDYSLIIYIGVGCFVVLQIVIVTVCVAKLRSKKKEGSKQRKKSSSKKSDIPHAFNYEQLKRLDEGKSGENNQYLGIQTPNTDEQKPPGDVKEVSRVVEVSEEKPSEVVVNDIQAEQAPDTEPKTCPDTEITEGDLAKEDFPEPPMFLLDDFTPSALVDIVVTGNVVTNEDSPNAGNNKDNNSNVTASVPDTAANATPSTDVTAAATLPIDAVVITVGSPADAPKAIPTAPEYADPPIVTDAHHAATIEDVTTAVVVSGAIPFDKVEESGDGEGATQDSEERDDKAGLLTNLEVMMLPDPCREDVEGEVTLNLLSESQGSAGQGSPEEVEV